MWTDHLHKGIFMFSNPRVMYLGMQDQYFTFTMFDAQAWYARDYIMGKITMPLAEAMRQEFAIWHAREEKLNSEEDEINFQADYIDDLVKVTDYPIFDLQKYAQLFIDWVSHYFTDCILNKFLHACMLTLPCSGSSIYYYASVRMRKRGIRQCVCVCVCVCVDCYSCSRINEVQVRVSIGF